MRACACVRALPLATLVGHTRLPACLPRAQAISWLPPGEEALLMGLSRWNASLTAATSAYIRGDPQFYELIADVLLPSEISWLCSVDAPPIACLQVMSRLLKRCVAAELPCDCCHAVPALHPHTRAPPPPAGARQGEPHRWRQVHARVHQPHLEPEGGRPVPRAAERRARDQGEGRGGQHV